MPVRRFDPTMTVAQAQLVDRLAAEWNSPTPDAAEPVILEEANSRGDIVHVYVVWNEWSQLDRIQRGEVIMEAAEKVKPAADVSKITIAMGLTPEEADRFGINWR